MWRDAGIEGRRGDFGLTLPVLLGTWAVCAGFAFVVWFSIAGNVPGSQAVPFISWLVLALSFGFAGVGLVSMAVDIVRRP